MKRLFLVGLVIVGWTVNQAHGQLFVSDQPQNDILRFDLTTHASSVFVPNGQQSSPDQPTDIVFGPDGNLYVATANGGTIDRYNGSTGAPMPAGNAPNAVFAINFTGASSNGLAFGLNGNLYVTNQNNVTEVNGMTGAFIQNFAPSSGSPLFAGIALGTDGKFYISDRTENNIVKFDPVSGMFSTFVTGGSQSASGLVDPTGITVGPGGDLFVSSAVGAPAIGGQVLRFSGTTGAFINAFVPSNNNGGLQEPQDLVFGSDGNLYVASFFHNPPPGTPVVNSFVERYSGVNGMPIDQFTGTSSDGFFGLAFPTLATVPEAGTFAIGGAVSLALLFHFARRKRNRKAA